MKKIVSALIVAALLVCCMIPAAFAAEAISVSVNSVETTAGGTATLSVSVPASAFASYGFALSYDQDVLKIQSITEGDVKAFAFMPNADTAANTGNVGTIGFADAETAGGVIFTVTFAVAADAAPGTYPVSFTGNVTNAAAEALFNGTATGNVIVKVGEHECDWVETSRVDATCTEAGSITYTCSICGETKTEAIAALGHTWGEWTVTTAPACEVAGEQTRTCSVCGATETEPVAALEHQWGEWIVVKEAAIDVEGLMERTCSVCGAKQEQVIPALPNPDIDPTPGTPGDITLQLTAGIATVVVALFAAVAFVFKRKTAK